jgi:ribonucleoside-diphosphate reductase alpha chain
MYVTKRDGSLEEFDLNKTRKVINWACENLNVSTLELESQVDIIFKDKVNTQDIQENLISHALSLVDLDHYDWLKVAANLRIMTRYKIYREIPFNKYVKEKISIGEYSKTLLIYNDNDLLEAFSWVDKEFDKNYDYAGASILINKFLLNNEPLQYLYLASALVIASCESSKENQLQLAKEFYYAFCNKKISLSTPILSNVRRGNSNLASCFIGSMGDSLDDIFKTIHKVAKISKNGGGIGLYIGNIRCNGSWVKNIKGAARGVCPWIKILNDTVVAVNQLGKI